jgi:MFS family permease
MIYPLLPSFLLTALGGNRFHLGIIEGAADLLASLLKLWSGRVSDRISRRRSFVVAGYFLTVTARPLIGLVVAPWQLFLARTFDRIGKGIRTAPRDALIADSTDSSSRGQAYGFHRAMDHLGAAVGPIMAFGFLTMWPGDLRTLFVLTLIPGALVMCLLIFGLRESPVGGAGDTIADSIRREADGRKNSQQTKVIGANFRTYLWAIVIFTLGNASDAFLLVRAEEIGVTTSALPLLWCAFHIAKSISNFYMGRAVDRWGPRRFIAAGWCLYASVYLAFGLASEWWHAWCLFLGYALFFGMTEPAEKALVTALAGKEQKGRAFGWFHFAIGITTLPSSLLFGAIYEFWGPLAAFSWGAGLAIFATIFLIAVKSDAGNDR